MLKKIGSSLVIAGLGVFGLLATTGPAVSQGARTQLSVYEAETGFAKVIDAGKKGFGAGDTILENLPLFNPTTDAKVGKTVTVIHVVRLRKGDPLVWIDCEVELGDGTITFSGGTPLSDVFGDGAKLSVTGGTGAYLDAAGAITISHVERDGASTFDFDFDLQL